MNHRPYGVQLFDDIHNYLPDLLYNQNRFRDVHDIFRYINYQMRIHFDRYTRARNEYRGIGVSPGAGAANYLSSASEEPQVPVPPPPPQVQQPVYTWTYTNPTADLLNTLAIFERIIPPLSPVNVFPSINQIANASTIRTIDAATASQEICSICQENMQVGNVVRTLNACNHTFHRSCIDRWFAQSVHCPMCRHDIRDVDDDESTISDSS